MANPNPQNRDAKYKGIRDLGYNLVLNPDVMLSDPVRFGKKVNIDKPLSNDQILEAHLNQIRQNVENSRLSKEHKKQQD